METRQLQRLLRVFSALVPALGGCGESIDTSQFSEDLCNEEGLHILGSLTPASAADYLELRDVTGWDAGEGLAWNAAYVRDSSGQRCAGAADPAACGTEFEALSPESEFTLFGFEGTVHRSLAYTRADEVGAITGRAPAVLLHPGFFPLHFA